MRVEEINQLDSDGNRHGFWENWWSNLHLLYKYYYVNGFLEGEEIEIEY
jgi:hypothetical protein